MKKLNSTDISTYIDVSEEALKPFDLNLDKVILQIEQATNYFPDYDAIEDEDIKDIYFKAVALQWLYMIENIEMYTPAEALRGEKVGRHSYNGLSQKSLDSFSKVSPLVMSMLERNGLTNNALTIDGIGVWHCDQ